MKIDRKFRGAAAALLAVFALSSCASTEIRVTEASSETTTAAVITQFATTAERVEGLVLINNSDEPITAAPMPSPVVAEPDTAEIPEEPALYAEPTPEDTTAATTKAAETAPAQTATAAASAVTTAAEATTAKAATTAAAATTPPPETTTTTAVQTAAAPAVAVVSS